MSIAERVTPNPHHPPGWLIGQLPVGMRDDDMLIRFMTIFERIAGSVREAADGVDHVSDLQVTTPDVVIYFGRWLGYDILDRTLDVERLRTIVAALGSALPIRGTVLGLRTILEAVTDGPVRIEETGGVFGADDVIPPRSGIEVTVASTGHLREHELRALVRDEVPAHLPVSFVVDGSPEGWSHE